MLACDQLSHTKLALEMPLVKRKRFAPTPNTQDMAALSQIIVPRNTKKVWSGQEVFFTCGWKREMKKVVIVCTAPLISCKRFPIQGNLEEFCQGSFYQPGTRMVAFTQQSVFQLVHYYSQSVCRTYKGVRAGASCIVCSTCEGTCEYQTPAHTILLQAPLQPLLHSLVNKAVPITSLPH